VAVARSQQSIWGGALEINIFVDKRKNQQTKSVLDYVDHMGICLSRETVVSNSPDFLLPKMKIGDA
jgi:hypothetical protein